MIYLSRLDLNPASRQVRAELASPYEMHRTLSKAFGDGEGEFAAARCLFRVDDPPTGSGPWALVQSLSEPCWQRLTLSSAYLAGPPQVKAIEPAFRKGQRLAFRLRANPTVKREGKRLGLVHEEEQEAWLLRKAQQSGFDIQRLVVHPTGRCQSLTTKGHDALLLGVTFDGVLRVQDPPALFDALMHGIGSGKAFGFGLLSLAPA